jgi:hypothetical protein
MCYVLMNTCILCGETVDMKVKTCGSASRGGLCIDPVRVNAGETVLTMPIYMGVTGSMCVNLASIMRTTVVKNEVKNHVCDNDAIDTNM